MRLIRRAAAALSALMLAPLALAACGSSAASEGGSGFVAGDGSMVVLEPASRIPAPDVTGPLLGGGEFRLADYRGQVVVLNVWASWCAPCRAEAPALESVATSYADRGVAVVGLNTRDSQASAEAFVEANGITYPSVVDTDGRLQLLFRDSLPPQAIPSTIVVDAEGRVAARILGEATEAALSGLVDAVLTERPAPS